MAIDIKFDLVGNPEPPTIVLANRNGNKLGQLQVDEKSIDISDKFNDASEFSFTMNKYIDGKLTNLWDKVVDFKLVYCKEWNLWFEIKVELDEATETVKTVFCTQLGQAELSQIMLYNIEINTEEDIERESYKISILYNAFDNEASILHRILKDKAPHYSIIHVDSTIANIQRSFSFDGTSIYDAFQEIAEEIGCLFVFHSNSDEDGKIQRTISVFDLEQNCNVCGHRGEFTDVCPKCGSNNIKHGYGEDTSIFVTSDELASSGIQLVTDTDSVKNCFKLEAGDDLMTATIRNCNPNGTDYIYYFSDAVKEDMTDELVERIESYDELYRQYQNEYVSNIDTNLLGQYNSLVNKYSVYNEDLKTISTPIKGYSSLMNAYYGVIDLGLYLESGLMPNVEMSETNATLQARLLTTSAISPIAVTDVSIVSLATADSVALSMARTIVKSTYKVQVKESQLIENGSSKSWRGNFTISNYSDEEDVADSGIITVAISDNLEEFIKQKIDKLLNKENTDDLSITGLFKKDYTSFCAELKKYALNPLTGFHDACQACIDILIEQGVATPSSDNDLYQNLYVPYYNKLKAVEAEMKIREDELNIIIGVYDVDDNLITEGFQSNIEKCRNKIQDTLNFEKYLGYELYKEFSSYRREDKYSNDNYISDGLNNAELFKRAKEFYDVAEKEIFKSAELQHSISTTLNNLLAIPKFKPLVSSFKTGNWIRVQVDDDIYRLRLLEYGIDFGNFDNISVEFSDVTKVKNGYTDVESILNQASSMATSYGSVQRQASKGEKANSDINIWVKNGLNSGLINITNNTNEEIAFDKSGLWARVYDDVSDSYDPEQFRITHNVLAFTNDNWETVRQCLGKHDYQYFDNNGSLQKATAYGLTSDFVTSGVVTGSQIIGGEIYSSNYTYNSGTYINLIDGTFSFGGGSLKFENGTLSIDSPDIMNEEQVTEISENCIKTTDVEAKNLRVSSANIQGKLTASQINTTGLIAENISGTTITGKTISGGTITGATINNGNGTFSVSSSGYLNATNVNIKGSISGSAISGGTIDGSVVSGVTGSFSELSCGNSVFAYNYIAINAGWNTGYIRIGDADYQGWEDVTIRPSSNGVGNIGTPAHTWDMLYVRVNAGSSTRSIKEDIQTYNTEQAYEELRNLPIYTYFYKGDSARTKAMSIGTMIDYMPTEAMITTLNDNDTYNVSSMMFWNIAASQVMQKKLEDLILKVDEIESKLNYLEV